MLWASLALGATPFGLHGAPLADVGLEATFIVAGDFNSDGHIDLALAEYGGTRIVVLLGNGHGDFVKTQTVFSQPATGLAAVDYDADGKVDLLIAISDEVVGILLNDGNGPFSTTQQFADRAQWSSAFDPAPPTADFDGNGTLDAVSTDPEFCDGENKGSLLIAFNSPDAPPLQRSFPVQPCISQFVIADFNGDGLPDVAATLFGERPPVAAVAYFLNVGQGNFRTQTGIPAGTTGRLIAADANEDGMADLIVVTNTHVAVLLGSKSGELVSADVVASVSGVSMTAVATDLDGDGRADVAITNRFDPDRGGLSNVTVLRGQPDGSLGSARTLATGNYPVDLAAADVNGDRRSDLVVANGISSDLGGDNSISVLLQRADGEFEAQPAIPLGDTVRAVAATDLTDNGTADIVATGNKTWTVLSGPTGTFAAPTQLPTYGNAVAIGDLDEDRIPDVIIGNDAGVVWLRGIGAGRFDEPRTTLLPTFTVALALGDLNRDGHLDVVAVGGTYSASSLSILLGRGDGSFRTPYEYALSGVSVRATIHDFDQDGVEDLAVAMLDGISLFRGNGGGTFEAAGALAGRGVYTTWVGLRSDHGRDEVLALNLEGSLLSYGSPVVTAPSTGGGGGGGCNIAAASSATSPAARLPIDALAAAIGLLRLRARSASLPHRRGHCSRHAAPSTPARA